MAVLEKCPIAKLADAIYEELYSELDMSLYSRLCFRIGLIMEQNGILQSGHYNLALWLRECRAF